MSIIVFSLIALVALSPLGADSRREWRHIS
jgi:hypothetical protein